MSAEAEPAAAPAQCALLIVDVQNDFVADGGRVARDGGDVASLRRVVPAINGLVAAAREAGAVVTYVRVEHGPDIDRAPYRARYLRRGFDGDDVICRAGGWGAELFGELLPPRPDDLQVVKHAYDGFQSEPELAARLREAGVTTVVVTGVVTEVCVAATACAAFEHGFFVLVPREGTASLDAAAEAAALGHVDAWYGSVVPAAAILEQWRSGRTGA